MYSNERFDPDVLHLLSSDMRTVVVKDSEDTLRAGSHGSQVPSPTHVSKSQHGGKVPTFEPQETIKIWLIIIKVGS